MDTAPGQKQVRTKQSIFREIDNLMDRYEELRQETVTHRAYAYTLYEKRLALDHRIVNLLREARKLKDA